MLGRNSVVGTSAALDGPSALNTAIAQVESTGMEIAAGVLKRLASKSEALRIALVHHEHALSAQTQQVAACNALHELEERLSRWLLQSRDLLQRDTLPLTQEFLAQMLGVQRSSVTLVARKLQEAGLIRYRRGHIHVLEVEGLQKLLLRVLRSDQSAFQQAHWLVTNRSPNSAGRVTESPRLFLTYVRFQANQHPLWALESRRTSAWPVSISTSRMARS